MKKRIVSAILAVLTLCSIMASTALAVEESTQSLRAGVLVCPMCDKGTFYSYREKNGPENAYSAICPDGYSCIKHVQYYTTSQRCSVCMFEYNIDTKPEIWWDHNH